MAGISMRQAYGILVAGVLALALSACTGQVASSASASAAANGYGSRAAVMLRAVLRPGTCGEQGARLSQRAIWRAGVVFSGYTPAGGLTVGIGGRADVSQVERWLRGQPAVLSVRRVPLPSGPPASAPKTVPSC